MLYYSSKKKGYMIMDIQYYYTYLDLLDMNKFCLLVGFFVGKKAEVLHTKRKVQVCVSVPF